MEKTFEDVYEQFENTSYPAVKYEKSVPAAITDVIRSGPLPIEYCFHVVLIAASTDYMGYTSYVFKNLDSKDPRTDYIMCVRFPNWNMRALCIGEIGYVNLRYVKAGVESWFDGKTFVPYKNNGVHFLNFISESDDGELNGWKTENQSEIENDEE